MRLMHNPEIRVFVWIESIITIVLTVICLFINAVCALLVFIMEISFLICFLVFERKRYQRIQALSEELDAVLNEGKDISVEKLIDDSLETLAIPLDVRNIQVIKNISDAVICADAYWTNEAFVNIIKNCMEHVQENGIIKITASETPLFTDIKIQDNGEGFSREDLPHIFERFYKGKNASAASAGIGLALAKTIIHAQNGMIQASDNPEGGACFSIRFYKQVI